MINLNDEVDRPAGTPAGEPDPAAHEDTRTLEALRESEERFRRLCDATREGVVIHDDGVVVEANRACEELFGYESGGLVGTLVFDHIAREDRRTLRRIRAEDVERPYEVTAVRRDGSRFVAEIVGRSIPLMGRVVRVVTVRDVTGRQAADEQVREAERRFRTLVEQLPATVFITAAEEGSRVLYMSPYHAQLTGYPNERFVQDPYFWRETIHPDDRERVIAEANRTDASGEPFSIEYRLVTADGDVVWVQEETVLVTDEHGTPRCWQGVMLDITARKAAEEDVAHALEREREASRRLRVLDQMKTTFLQAVSHELRTPLTTILGSALTLSNADVAISTAESADLLGRLVDNARKLDRLLSDLLDLDRLSRGIVEPKRRPLDVTAAIHATVAQIRSELDGHSVIVDDAVAVFGVLDAAKLERILENLLVNAARHTSPGTPICVRAERRPEGVLIVVEDSGPGVPPELRSVIFEPFRQGTSDGESRGVGIGLALVARFAELHGGRAWVQDRVGGGASFRVFLRDA